MSWGPTGPSRSNVVQCAHSLDNVFFFHKLKDPDFMSANNRAYEMIQLPPGAKYKDGQSQFQGKLLGVVVVTPGAVIDATKI